MAIRVTISKAYAWRMLIIGGVCAGLGIWGVYDYAVKIPRLQQLHERHHLLDLCQAALQTEQRRNQLSPEAQEAYQAINEEVNRIIGQELARVQGLDETISTPQQLQEKLNEVGQSIQSSEDAQWLGLLSVIAQGLVADRRLPLTQQNYPSAHAAFQATQDAIDAIGEVTAPGKYDRITQWAFILCLPCAPYFFWMFFAVRRRVYQLDDDGTLHLPEGTWKPQDIADIDMSRWMAKSIAHVEHRDGTRAKLDDYKYRNLHLIVGAIASRLHPDDWDAEAKPIKAAAASEPAGARADEDAPDEPAAEAEPAGSTAPTDASP